MFTYIYIISPLVITVYLLELLENEVKKKWKNLRDTFIKELREKKKPSGSARKNRKEWYLFENMKFIMPFCQANKYVLLTYLRDQQFYVLSYNLRHCAIFN